MFWWKLKEKLKAIKPKQWVFIVIMTLFVIIGIACAIISLYMSGHTIGTWLAKYYPWIVLAVIVIYLVVFTWILFKKRNNR